MTIALLQRDSSWQYKSSNSGGIGAGPVAGQLGEFVLTDPSGSDVKFNWTSLGFGASFGVKLPATGTYSTTQMPDVGSVHILPWFTGKELSRRHFTGLCCIREFSAGLVAGVSAMEVYFGIDLFNLKTAIHAATNQSEALLWLGKAVSYTTAHKVLSKDFSDYQVSINGVMYVAGITSGLQLGVGANVLLGTIW